MRALTRVGGIPVKAGPDFRLALELSETLRVPPADTDFPLAIAAVMQSVVHRIELLCDYREPVPAMAREVAAAIEREIAHGDVPAKPLPHALARLIVAIHAAEQTFAEGRPSSEWRRDSVNELDTREPRPVSQADVISIEEARDRHQQRLAERPSADPA